MKKFLTVLLALSVVFTYTVGTAFASVATDQIDAKATAEKTDLSDMVDDTLKTIVYNQDGYVVVPDATAYANVNMISKSVVDTLGAKVKSDYSKAIDKVAKEQKIAESYDAEALKAAWAAVATEEGILNAVFADDCKDALIAQYAIEKTVALEKLAKINATAYNPFDYTDNGIADSEKDVVAKAVADAQALINEIEAPTTVNDAKNAITSVKSAAEITLPTATLAQQEKALEDEKTASKVAIDKYADALIKTLTKRYTDIITGGGTPSAVADAQVKLAALDANVATVVNKYVVRIDNAAIDADTTPVAASKKVTDAQKAAKAALETEEAMEGEIAAMGDVDALIAYAQQYATSMKTMINEDGTVKFNAATVDKALADVVAEIKNGLHATTASVKAALDATETAAMEKATLDAYKITKKKELKKAYPIASYSEDNAVVVKDLLEKYSKEIDATLDKEAVDVVVKEAKAELDKVLTSSEEATLETKVTTALNTYKYATAKEGKGGALEGYFDAMAAKNPTKNYAPAKNETLVNAAKVFYDAVLALNDADLTQTKVNAIVKDNYNNALAVIDATKSEDELKDAAKAVVALIDNIPSTVDASAKEAVLTALEAYNDYCDLAGADEDLITNESTLSAAVNKLIAVERKAVVDQINALNMKVVLGTFTLDDASAVEAARVVYDAYKDTYKDIAGYNLIADSTLKALETKVAELNFKDAANKINALPAEITVADADAVKAAAEAYARLTDAQKKAMNPLLIAKLEAAQKQLTALEIKSVESLKVVKNHSVAGKGYIKIAWSVKGDAAAADGYQIYRATKANGKYTKFFTTSKMTYKNTKSLKKGTKYYYKVRAYKTVDGVKYYSDWSNKAYRVAK